MSSPLDDQCDEVVVWSFYLPREIVSLEHRNRPTRIDFITFPVFYFQTVDVGALDVGFVDTANNLYETTVQTGDVFVFPKGTLHWQRNNGQGPASGFSVLSSENPGTLLVFEAVFTGGQKGIPDIVIATAANSNALVNEIDLLKQDVATRNNVTLNL